MTKNENPQFGGPLIALGASAGGLEPLEAFFQVAPSTAGWCFVVVQHLSPDYRSVMDELLGRLSALTILQIKDGQALAPDTIFLNPPNSIVRLDGGIFRLTPYKPTDKLPHLPIDAFFESMAVSPLPFMAAAILSGSGSDGARGAAKLHQAGGLVLVQTPKEAKFDSMPRAALVQGAVDGVLSAALMPDAIARALDTDHAQRPLQPTIPDDPKRAILRLLERQHRIDFSSYKSPTVIRRIERRQELRGLETIEDYHALLASDNSALEELYHDMLIGVTEFRRDPEAMSSLRRNALTQLVRDCDPDRELRIWVAACASGEEAYTIAIEISEVMRELGKSCKFRIIATDVHRPSVERAVAGIYRESSLEKISKDLRARYFIDHRNGVQVDPAIRRKVIFSVHDALLDPPFMRLDLVSCRNLLIYLDDDAQSRILSLFLFGLRQDGYLFLGASESAGHSLDDLAVVDGKWRLYRKTTDRRRLDPPALGRPNKRHLTKTERYAPTTRPARPPLTAVDDSREPRRDRDGLLRGYDALLKRFAPSSILVTTDGTVLTWFGAASAYVDTISGLADWTVEEIVHPTLHYPINIAAERINQGEEGVFERTVIVDDDSETGHEVLVRVEPIGHRGVGGRFLLVSLSRTTGDATDAANQRPVQALSEDHDSERLIRRIKDLERDLRLTEESLQYVTERLEASGEELHASNEELHASNEELHASNEEMQSANEELHAVNEELVSVSAEHERKISLLSNLNHDTELIFEMLRVGIVILDADLRLQRYTELCGRAFELQAHDIGRQISNVGARPSFVSPSELARKALEDGRPQEVTGHHDGGPMTLRAVAFGQGGSQDRRGVMLLFSGHVVEAAIRTDHRKPSS